MNQANTFIFGSIVVILVLAGAFALFAGKDGDTTPVDTNEINDTDTMTTTHQELLAEKAVLKTNKGDVEIEFYDFAPLTANNFITLAQDGFYNGTRFHRVIEGFMIQGGDPQSADVSLKNVWGTGGPGYAIADEFAEGMTNLTGTIAMANAGANSGGSQFFINVADNIGLDFDKEPLSSKHPVFGRVTAGMDVVIAISQSPRDEGDRPLEDVIIEEVIIQ